MLKSVLVIAATLCPVAAFAQDVPDAAAMDMWCGTAFEMMTRDAPPGAASDKQAAAQIYADGAEVLIQRAIPIYLESGYSDAALASYRSKLEAEIGQVVNGSGHGTNDDNEYSFQDCSALIGQ